MVKEAADILFIEDDAVLLVRQRKPEAYGQWSFPGGSMEIGETPEEAVVREVREEIGAEVADLRRFDMNVFDADDGACVRLYTFTGQLVGAIVLERSEIMDAAWFTLGAATRMQDSLRKPMVFTLIQKALG